jgi:PAS domain S-box-containing protein
MPQKLRILFVEDLPTDQELAERELRAGGLDFDSLRVDTRADYLKAFEQFKPGFIISDYSMPLFDGMQALKIALEYDPEIPFIVLTGSRNEDTAVECMKAGASDYVIKEHVHRLPFAVQEALRRKQAKIEVMQAQEYLRESEAKFRAIFENNHAVMVLSDPETTQILDVNPAACAFYGWSHEEFIKKRITEINWLSNEELKKDIASAVKHEKSAFQFRHKLANGESRYVELFTGPIQHQGKTLLYSIIHDITARRQAEESLNSRNRDLVTLNNCAIELARLVTIDEVGKFVVKKLREFTGGAGCIFGLYDPEKKHIQATHSEIESSGVNDLLKALGGKRINDVSFPVNEINYQEMVQKPIQYNSSMSKASFGVIPEGIGKLTQKLQKVDRILMVAFVLDGQLFGAATLGLREGTQAPSNEMVNSFIQLVTITLSRVRAESALRQKMDELVRFQNLTVGRELKMIDLKSEINALLAETGKQPKYRITEPK